MSRVFSLPEACRRGESAGHVLAQACGPPHPGKPAGLSPFFLLALIRASQVCAVVGNIIHQPPLPEGDLRWVPEPVLIYLND